MLKTPSQDQQNLTNFHPSDNSNNPSNDDTKQSTDSSTEDVPTKDHQSSDISSKTPAISSSSPEIKKEVSISNETSITPNFGQMKISEDVSAALIVQVKS